MPSLSFVSRRSKNFTSVAAVRMPPSVSFDHYLGSAGRPSGTNPTRPHVKTSKIGPRSFSIIPCCSIQARSACVEHSVLFKVNWVGGPGHPVKGTPDCLRTGTGGGNPRKDSPPPTTPLPDRFDRWLRRIEYRYPTPQRKTPGR